MIELSGATVTLPAAKHDARKILKNIDLTVAEGEWVALVGPSGSGKTTLLRTLAGLLPLSSGKLVFGSVSRERKGVCQGERLSRTGKGRGDFEANPVPSFALLLQEPDNQFVASSVLNELLLSLPLSLDTGSNDVRVPGVPPGREGAKKVVSGRLQVSGGAEMRIGEAIERFSLGGLLERNPHRLSGGEKQRLALASVWLSCPDVLLLDEPTSFLDQIAKGDCLRFVRELNEAGVSVVWAAPGGDEVMHARTVAYLVEGEIRFLGSIGEFLSFAREGGAEFVSPRILALGESFVGALRERAHRAGREEEPLPAARSEEREKIVSFEAVSFAYAEKEVIRAVSFDIFSGECLGITGRNGSGKTTLLELAGGVLKPRSGTLFGKFPRAVEKGEQNVFYLFQSPERMFFAETVLEEISFGLRHLGVGRGDIFSHAKHALSRVGLDLDLILGRSPFSLSFGEMRRLALAIALALEPKLLLLDEPASCLDSCGRNVLLETINFFRDEGKTVVIASHDEDFLLEACGRIVFLEEGCVTRQIDISGRELPFPLEWPGEALPFVLEFQEVLAEAGLDVSPRLLSIERLVERIIENAATSQGC